MATSMEVIKVRWSAPSNIAVVKYWGKKSVMLNTPLNSSCSITLGDQLQAVTQITASTSYSRDTFFLNGEEQSIHDNKRLLRVLQEIRSGAADRIVEGKVMVKARDWAGYFLRIESHNSFPTAAGLASSAAGFACLTMALADLFAFRERFPGELSAIARQGSGSACRSMYGGFVRWDRGERDDGCDSIAVQVAPASYWPELEVVILVACAGEKDVGSTDGMQLSVATSSLLEFRAEHVVPGRVKEIESAFLRKDFETFGRITMQDSNQFHATCLDTFPPIFYLNDTSKTIIGLVHQFNARQGRIAAAYSFDAGPNAVIFTTKEYVISLLALFVSVYPPPAWPVSTGLAGSTGGYIRSSDPVVVASAMEAARKLDTTIAKPGEIAWMYHTTIGEGPTKIE